MRRWMWGLAVALFFVVACNTKLPDEHLGKATEALLTLGAPCDKNLQCTSGHCVDAVCCSTVCHTGAHADNHVCSNIYASALPGGVIPNLGSHLEGPGSPNAGSAIGGTTDPFPGTCITLD